MPDRDRTEEALARLREAEEAMTKAPWLIQACNAAKYPESEHGYPQRIVANDDGLVLVAECFQEPMLPDNVRGIVLWRNAAPALVAVVEATIGLKRTAAVHYKPSATASDLTLMSVEAFHRGLAIDAAEERFAAALASLSAAVLGEEESDG